MFNGLILFLLLTIFSQWRTILLFLVCCRLEIRFLSRSDVIGFSRQILEESVSEFREVLLKEPFVADELKFLCVRITRGFPQSFLIVQISFHDWVYFLFLRPGVILALLARITIGISRLAGYRST